eukprot:CAMPEP_0119290152 /NCGR_PEP_ID=MMETSP1329-20130426/40264_1 /TAXON_ID=114041 /ORGANISM="Genus nov. species nov., Strain RCC1024" /LENGTH=112 /DNA_ID=CAMNT_0007290967 /DNA_START=162 /DNA_END=497 /DNA_ORIENTATION=-
MMRILIALLTVATALKPTTRKPSKLGSSIQPERDFSFEQYQSLVDYCVVKTDATIEQCMASAQDYTVKLQEEARASATTRVENQLAELASHKNPWTAPVHLEYIALLAMVMI